MTLPLLITPHTFVDASSLEDECHLWFLNITQVSQQSLQPYLALLSETELLRAQQLTRRQAEFIVVRAFVRLCLSRYTQISPQLLEFETTAKGKPFLTNADTPISFNLSHCNHLVIIAINMEAEIGVDIESLARSRGQRDIAKRFFNPREIAQLAQLDELAHTRYFFRLWTLKEAFFKATGNGISAGLEKAAFEFNDGKITAYFDAGLNTRTADWQFHQEFLTSEFCVAVARHTAQSVKTRWFDGANLFQPLTL